MNSKDRKLHEEFSQYTFGVSGSMHEQVKRQRDIAYDEARNAKKYAEVFLGHSETGIWETVGIQVMFSRQELSLFFGHGTELRDFIWMAIENDLRKLFSVRR